MSSVTILVPTYNEEAALPETIESLTRLEPQPDEILLVDGGSTDATLRIAQEAGLRCLVSSKKGRGAQINLGVEQAKGDVVCVLHADSHLPTDAVTVIASTMAHPAIALASFTPKFVGPKRVRWGSTIHNFLKTWYAPLLIRPDLFFRGVRMLFGDHAMFFRAEDFIALGGCDERLAVLEEARLCTRFASLGKTKMVRRWVETSDRRITELGSFRANYTYLKVGLMWAMGAREKLADHYPDIR